MSDFFQALDRRCRINRSRMIGHQQLNINPPMADPDFCSIAESPNFVLAHCYESVFVIDKRDGSKRVAGDHYGDPSAGLITPDERWFVSVGQGVQCFSSNGRLLTFFRRGYPPLDSVASTVPAWFMSAVELDPEHRLRVPVDPASDEASTWTIDLEAETVTRLP